MSEKLTEVVLGEQELTDEERELVKTVYSRLETFERGCRPYHTEARGAREVLRLRDPEQDPPGRRHKALQLHTLKATITNCVADQMENMPEPKILPEVPGTEKIAEDLQDALRYIIYDVNGYEELHRRRAEDLYGPGTAVTQIVWDPDLNYGKGDVALIRWPVEAFLWDPKAENIEDARALMKVSWHPLSWFKEHYPDEAKWVNAEEGLHNNVGMSEAQREKDTDDEDRALLVEYWYREYNAKKHRYTISVAYCAGGALLYSEKDVYMHGMYPFVLDVHDVIEGVPVGEGLVSEMTPMMRYINRYADYIDTNLKMSSKSRMLVRRGSGISKKDLADWDNDLIEGNSVVQGEDWNWMQHAPLNAMIVNQMASFQNDMKQDSGMNQWARGETSAGVISGKAIMALQESGGKIAGLRTDTLNIGFRKIVQQIIWLMSEFYEDDRMIMITGRVGEENKVISAMASLFFGYKKLKGAVTPPPYNVQVYVQKRNPNYVAAQNEMFTQAYTMAAQAGQFFPLSSWLQLINVDGKDRLLPIVEEAETYQQQMQQLQAQLEQAQAGYQEMQEQNNQMRRMNHYLVQTLGKAQSAGMGYVAEPGQPVTSKNSPGTLENVIEQNRSMMQQNPPQTPV